MSKPHKFAETLTSSQKAALKGLAHHLKPVVQVGNSGLTPSVRAEVARALETHELVKIQLPGQNSAGEKQEAVEELGQALPQHTHVVDRIGRTAILYLEKAPDEAKITLKSL